MTLTRQLRKGAGSGEMGRTCAGLGSGGPELSPGRLLCATLDISLLSLGLSSLLGKVGMIITAPLTSQAGGEDLRDDRS